MLDPLLIPAHDEPKSDTNLANLAAKLTNLAFDLPDGEEKRFCSIKADLATMEIGRRADTQALKDLIRQAIAKR